jgi:hypothetical protein
MEIGRKEEGMKKKVHLFQIFVSAFSLMAQVFSKIMSASSKESLLG